MADKDNIRIRKVTYPPILTIPTITLSGVPAAYVGALVTVTATVTNAGSSYNIEWYNRGIQFATTTVPSVTYTKPAGIDTITARVVSTATYGCYDSITSSPAIVTVNTEGINTVFASTLYVYPNPANSMLNITGSNITSVAITNLIGQVLYSQQYNSPQVQVDVSTLPTGMYLIRINGSDVRKFVKE